MISGLIYIVLFAMLVVLAIAFTIYSLVKKKKQYLPYTIGLFMIGVIGCTYASYQYAKKVFAYVQSDDMQAAIRRGGRLAGETAGSAASGVSEGVATTLDEDAIAALARKSGAIIGKSLTGISSGLDSTAGSNPLFMDSSLAESGIEPGRGTMSEDDDIHSVTIFMEFKKGYKGTLALSHFDQTGAKIDEALLTVSTEKGTSGRYTFTFGSNETGFTTYYMLGERK